MIVVAVPELDQFGAAPDGLPPVLRAILARAECRALQADAWACELVTGQAVAAAPLTRLLDAPDDCEGMWLRADPIRLQPDLNAVWVSPDGCLQGDHPLVAEFQSVLGEAGLSFDIPHPERGYVRLDQLPDCQFVSPDRIIGQSLDFVLPSGSDAAFWRRLMKDCQVIAHQHALNAAPGGPAGLWFWGGGARPPGRELQPRVQRLFGLDPLLVATARWLDLSHDVATAPSAASLPDSSLVEWRPDSGLDGETALLALDRWLRPLWRRLKLGRLDVLEVASRTRVWRLSSAAAWQLWRRSAEPWT